jgi:aspartate/methionine/tyrosine aminotransferase
MKPKSIVALDGMLSRSVILHTYSKSFSMTGWRLGAAIGPKEIIAHINRLNTNDEACTTHFIQWAGLHLTSPDAQEFIHSTLIPELKRRRDLVRLLQITLFMFFSPLEHISPSLSLEQSLTKRFFFFFGWLINFFFPLLASFCVQSALPI